MRGFLGTLARGTVRGLTETQALQEAFYLIADRNPLPAVCGRLCPHHCETGCTREAYDGAVSVNQVERAIAEAAIQAGWPLTRAAGEPRGEAVTVIGAGAAGLSAAYQLARRGYQVTLADSHEAAGGELRYGIGDAQLPRAILDAEIDRILALGVTFAGGADLQAVEGGRGARREDEGLSGRHAGRAWRHCGRGALRPPRRRRCSTPSCPGRPLETAARLPVAKDKVQPDYHQRQTRGETTGETWSTAAAKAEALRCLSCGACFECDSCWKYCPDQAVIRPTEPGQPYRFKLEFCQGCAKCAEQCPSHYIEMR